MSKLARGLAYVGIDTTTLFGSRDRSPGRRGMNARGSNGPYGRIRSYGNVAESPELEYMYQTESITSRARRTIGPATVFNADTFMKIPPFPMRYADMYTINDLEPVSRACTLALRKEVLRRGFIWKPLWTSKCPKCGCKYNREIPLDRCPKCDPQREIKGEVFSQLAEMDDIEDMANVLMEHIRDVSTHEGTMLYPDPKEYYAADEFLKCCNESGQPFIDVLGSALDDMNIVDDSFLVIRKKYRVGTDGRVLKAAIHEVQRGSPSLMRKVIDQFNRTGGRWWKCMICGAVIESDIWGREQVEEGEPDVWSTVAYHRMPVATPPRCDHCGNDHLEDVRYFGMRHEYGVPEQFYTDGEVIHWQYYRPGPQFGGPPGISLFVIQTALLFQNIYIRDFFEKRKIPPGFMSVQTSNPKGFWNFWKKMMIRWRVDKMFLPVAISETDVGTGGSGGAKFIKIMDNLAEMQYTEARNEMRQRISSFYGVSATFMDDARQTGNASSSDGIQLVVSNRTAEAHQRLLNETVLPRLTRMMGIKNWVLQVRPTEDRDELKQQQIMQYKLQNSQMFKSLDFEVDLDEQGEFVYWKKTFTEEDAMRFAEVMNYMQEPAAPGMGSGMDGGSSEDGGEMQSYTPGNEGDTQPSGKGQGKDSKPENVRKGDGEGEPSKVGPSQTGRAMGRTKTDIGQTPRSGSTYTPGARGVYQCRFCGQTFPSKQALGAHVKNKHGGGKPGNQQALEQGPGMDQDGEGDKFRAFKFRFIISSLLGQLNSKIKPNGMVFNTKKE